MSDYILCPRVENIHPASLVAGTAKTVCTFCGEEVWISPSGEELRKKIGFDVICVQCMNQNFSPMETPPIVQELTMTFMGIFQKLIQDIEESARKAAEARRREIWSN